VDDGQFNVPKAKAFTDYRSNHETKLLKVLESGKTGYRTEYSLTTGWHRGIRINKGSRAAEHNWMAAKEMRTSVKTGESR
jgi:hypothetical protein